MDGDGGSPHDFLSQAAASSAAAFPIDGDGWGLTPPRLRGGTGSGGRAPVAGGLGAPRVGLDNLDLNLNSDCAVVSSYPNLGMYSHILQSGSTSSHRVPPQRARSDGVLQRPGRPPRQGLPPLRAADRCGNDVALSGRADGGSSSSGSARQRQAVPILQDDVGEEDEEEEDDIMLNHHSQRPKSKANWTEENTLTLCEIACEEIDAGNFAGRIWNPQAYKNMKEKYWERVKLWHPGREVKNKMTALKTLYTDWVWLQQQTGCGRGPNGEATATPAWWAREIKARPNLKKFRRGNPEYMPLLHEIYHEVAVDGTSAYVPGPEEENELNNDDDDLDVNEGFEPSPMSTNSRKRGSSSIEKSTTSSPSKRSKTNEMADSPTHGKTRSPFVRYMKDINTKLEKEAEKSDAILQAIVNQANQKARKSEERAQSVANCQNLAIECGATEETIEYFVACDLFKEKHNRFVFQNMKTPEARWTWLKRWCKAKNVAEKLVD